MNPAAIAVQIGLIVVPVVLFVGLKSRLATLPLRLVAAVIVAFLGGALTYFMAAEFGWRPAARGGATVPLAPMTLAMIHAGGVLFTCVVLSVAKRRDAAGRGRR